MCGCPFTTFRLDDLAHPPVHVKLLVSRPFKDLAVFKRIKHRSAPVVVVVVIDDAARQGKVDQGHGDAREGRRERHARRDEVERADGAGGFVGELGIGEARIGITLSISCWLEEEVAPVKISVLRNGKTRAQGEQLQLQNFQERQLG